MIHGRTRSSVLTLCCCTWCLLGPMGSISNCMVNNMGTVLQLHAGMHSGMCTCSSYKHTSVGPLCDKAVRAAAVCLSLARFAAHSLVLTPLIVLLRPSDVRCVPPKRWHYPRARLLWQHGSVHSRRAGNRRHSIKHRVLCQCSSDAGDR